MKITHRFSRVLFSPATIRLGFDSLARAIRATPALEAVCGETDPAPTIRWSNLMVTKGPETIEPDTEDEFFADYLNTPDRATFFKHIGSCCLHVHYHNHGTDVTVDCPLRGPIDAALNCFKEAAPHSRLADPPPPPKPTPPPRPKPKVFIGHGRDLAWRELKDHLADKHDLDIVAYEVGARAGHTVRDVLEEMLTRSSIAFLVLTGEDRDADGQLHARENVIHETGLFQGHLGFSRGVVILEEGTTEFSNIHGIDQLRFSKGNIKEVFGDVLAVLRREFGPLP